MSNIFEQASRQSLRFNTAKGVLNTEDLWHLPLTSKTGSVNLNDLAREYHKQMTAEGEISFVDSTAKTDTVAELKFNIVKHIIDFKVEQRDREARRVANQRETQRIMQFLADRQDEEMKTKSVEELTEMLRTLQATES